MDLQTIGSPTNEKHECNLGIKETLKVRTASKCSPQIKRPKPMDYTTKKNFFTSKINLYTNVREKNHTFPAKERCQCCRPHHKPMSCQRDFQEDRNPQPSKRQQQNPKQIWWQVKEIAYSLFLFKLFFCMP